MTSRRQAHTVDEESTADKNPNHAPTLRKDRCRVLVLTLATLVGASAALAWIANGASLAGAFADYPHGVTGPEVLVHITGKNNSDFADSLVLAGVVKSAGAFNYAAGDKPISAGYYELRKTMPASEVVAQLTDPTRRYRVGMLSIQAGMQLDDKTNKDNKVAPGIFSQISDATTHTEDGVKKQIPASAFARAAAAASATELGVPRWAEQTVNTLKGDPRRIEGLIAPGAWQEVDPSATPISILRNLISTSAKTYEMQGLLNASSSSPASLTPYEVLVSASIVEREVNSEQDYSKVARVILNRLAKKQRLEMDSTVNYTEAVTSIDVFENQLLKTTGWNTYAKKGLPVTPIGAVSDNSITATESPEPGPWLYFVTIDSRGTTLFTDNYAQHRRNREKACRNRFLTAGCAQ